MTLYIDTPERVARWYDTLSPRQKRLLRRLEGRAKNGFVPAYDLAVIHIALNENDAALKYLQRAYDEHDWAMFVAAVEPRLDPLRSTSGFRELVRKLALPA